MPAIAYWRCAHAYAYERVHTFVVQLCVLVCVSARVDACACVNACECAASCAIMMQARAQSLPPYQVVGSCIYMAAVTQSMPVLSISLSLHTAVPPCM